MDQSQEHLVFSADDFGISAKANARILELVESGVIHRVSVMIDGLLPPEDIARLLQSHVLLDLHLEVKNPLRTKRKLKENAITQVLFFLLGYCTGAISTKQITSQWEKQIQRFNSLFGKFPDSLNSHEHMHFFPSYFRITLALAKKYAIPSVRIGTEPIRENLLTAHILNFLRLRNIASFRRSRLASFDFVVSFDWLPTWKTLETYPSDKTIEIIFHPERDEEMGFLKNFKKKTGG